MDVCMRMCFPQTFLTVKDLDNLYDVNCYVLLSGVTSVCKNVIMLQAKNIDKSHDYEGVAELLSLFDQQADLLLPISLLRVK